MRIVVQRVSSASVTIGGEVKSSIGRGLLVLLGIGHCDGADDIDYLVKKAPRSIVIEGVTSTGRQGYFAFGKDE